MPVKKIDLGPTGMTVAHNIRRLRESQRFGYTELSRALSDLGREIPALGLRRIEAGARRVDVDDLMALAVALGVSPATLLAPDTTVGDEMVLATGLRELRADSLWFWLKAEAALWQEGGGRDWIEFASVAWPTWTRRSYGPPRLSHNAKVGTDGND
jgi:transcriptional regulator with XRE-family HTH domain